jgi:endonuclease YncB( thermonuclease family)
MSARTGSLPGKNSGILLNIKGLMNYHCGRSAPEKRQIKVRLTEIDAPEKSQAFGQRSKQSLSDLVFDKQIRVEQQDIDRYGRVVGRVYAGGLDVNAEQIRRGMA